MVMKPPNTKPSIYMLMRDVHVESHPLIQPNEFRGHYTHKPAYSIVISHNYSYTANTGPVHSSITAHEIGLINRQTSTTSISDTPSFHMAKVHTVHESRG